MQHWLEFKRHPQVWLLCFTLDPFAEAMLGNIPMAGLENLRSSDRKSSQRLVWAVHVDKAMPETRNCARAEALFQTLVLGGG